MSDQAMLVKESWLNKVDGALLSSTGANVKPGEATSLFFDVRPAVLKSAWTQNAAGVWKATCAFLVNDVVDVESTQDVVAPTATSNPGGTVDETRFFVVWRGRWEMVAGAGSAGTVPALSTTLEAVLKAVNLQVSLTDTKTQGVLFSQSVMKSLYVQNGALYYESKFLNISTNQTFVNVVKSVSYASS